MKRTKRFRKALRGLDGMIVWVHDIAEDAAVDGLSRQHLQDLVIVRLLDSGIKALGIGNVPEPRGNPWLNVFVNTVKAHELYFISITVRLDEVVRPVRSQGTKTIGTTWEVSDTVVVDKGILAKEAEKLIDDLIEYFVYDYRVENPS
ncbi:MAG: hypothetical protein HY912_19275 [Desulfomonile tiedjei]|uniref:Uncharacterized protein n=1 Tax=Desulfomonile tiedjei TaxID=2358 RepID=A0A9D6Z525_9BACT|nr:hypothetical protein [Desulfomonile tiedjei]